MELKLKTRCKATLTLHWQSDQVRFSKQLKKFACMGKTLR